MEDPILSVKDLRGEEQSHHSPSFANVGGDPAISVRVYIEKSKGAYP